MSGLEPLANFPSRGVAHWDNWLTNQQIYLTSVICYDLSHCCYSPRRYKVKAGADELEHLGDCGKIVIFAIFAKFASIANFYGPPHCFVLCPVGDCGKIVIFAIFAKFASIANFCGPPHCFVLCPVGDCGKIVIFSIYFCQICQYRQLLWAPLLLSALPYWRLWQKCHSCHIC